MQLQISEKTFKVASGNECRCRFETKDARVAIAASWTTKPTEADRGEAMAFVKREIESAGANVQFLSEALAGPGVGGRARSAETMRRYLDTGDPGMEMTEYRPTREQP
jgi:hypothetical protein